MRYDNKAVYNPLETDFEYSWDSEKYVIPAKSLDIRPAFLIDYAANHLANHILKSSGKQQNDPSKPELIAKLLSHEFKIVDLTKEKKEASEEKK